MPESCLLYYITDRTAFPGDERARRFRLLGKITEAAGAGVNYIQLREKDLSIRELESLAREAVQIILQLRTKNRELRTDLLINSRTDVALATGAAGVHLPANDVQRKKYEKYGSVARALLPAKSYQKIRGSRSPVTPQKKSPRLPQSALTWLSSLPSSKRKMPPEPAQKASTLSVRLATLKFQCSRSEGSLCRTPTPACKPEQPASPQSASSRKTTSPQSSAPCAELMEVNRSCGG